MASFYRNVIKRVESHHGDIAGIEERLPTSLSAQALRKLPDHRYLAEMAACIFRAGFVWRVISQKWDGFEEVFNGFLPIWVASRSPEDIEAMAQDTRIVRYLTKVKAVQDNAVMILDLEHSHGGIGAFIADWPSDNIIGLWQYLKKHGSRLGGNTGQYFLRFVGKDSFILSRDVCTALRAEGLIDSPNPTALKELKKAQAAFNQLQQESGRTLAELSMLLALSLGPR